MDTYQVLSADGVFQAFFQLGGSKPPALQTASLMGTFS